MSRTSLGRALALLVATLTLAPAVLVVPAAQAVSPELDPGNRLGGITLDRTSGEMTVSGRPQTLTTETGCPEGYRSSSRVLFVWPDGSWPLANGSRDSGLPARPKIAGVLAGTGLDGAPIERTGLDAARWITSNFPPARFDGHSGVATYVITCDPGDVPGTTFPSADDGVGSSRYFSVDLRLTWTDGSTDGVGSTWEVVPETPIEKETTTTELTGAAQNDGSVRLSAAVAPSAATGTVTFRRGDGSTVATEPVSDGTATTVVGGLEADSQYTFTAEYSGDAAHDASMSGTLTVTTVGEPVPPQDTEVTVTIPAAASGLQFTITPGAVALGQAQLQGAEYVATGELGQVQVSDHRETRKRWTLSGTASPFTQPGGAGTIPSSALGWTPELVGQDNAGSAGPAVEPGTGLAGEHSLATADDNESLPETTVKAGLTLRAPQDTPEGAYTSTLTLTLI
jgi:hypothetical protein